MRTAPLSAAELAQIPEFVEKWTAIGLSTEPIDRDWAEWALAQFYDVAGLADPWVIWAPCPLSAVMSAVAYSAMKSSGLPQTLDRVLERVARDALMWPMNSMERSIRQAVGPMVNQALRMHAATASAGSPRHPIDNPILAALRAARHWALDPDLERTLERLIARPVDAVMEASLGRILRCALHRFTYNRAGRHAAGAISRLGAPEWLGHAALRDYADQVLGIPLDRGFIALIASCGLFWVFDGICFAAERPSHINRDEAGRLHGEVGPSLAFASGWSWWHWHGTEVPQYLIEEPQRIR